MEFDYYMWKMELPYDNHDIDRVNINLEEMKPSILEFASELCTLIYQGKELSLKYLSKKHIWKLKYDNHPE